MNKPSNEILLKNFFKSLDELRDAKILINKKDFTGQIGEWLVEILFDGKRSNNSIEKGWDVKVDNTFIQVKTHAKSETNNARWTAVKVDYKNIQIDFLIIVIFTENYKLKEFYKVPWKEVQKLAKVRGEKSPKSELTWNSVKNHKIEIQDLPKQDIIELFK
jgi:hypothetical protein